VFAARREVLREKAEKPQQFGLQEVAHE
jgi:hypothetical protein